jgi:hypothetical protein
MADGAESREPEANQSELKSEQLTELDIEKFASPPPSLFEKRNGVVEMKF